MIEEVAPQWFSASGRNTSPSATSQPNATPTPTSHQTTGRRGCRRYPTSPISQNGNGPSRSQVASGPSPWATDTAKAARITPPPSAANAATMARMPPLWE